MSARKKKSGGMVLRWASMLTHDDLPTENPGRVSVIAVALILQGYADADGRNCFPSLKTIQRDAGVSERTARLVLAWLVDRGWLTVTARARQRRPTTYRLAFPDTAEEHPLDEAQTLPRSIPWDSPGTAPDTAADTAEEQYNLRPPNEVKEEEEVADAPSAVASVAATTAPRSSGPLDLFSDQRGGDPSIQVLIDQIAKVADCPMDEPEALAIALAEAKARTGWSDVRLAINCISKLRRSGAKIAMPWKFLVTDLGRLDGNARPSAWMRHADEYAEMRDLIEADDDYVTLGLLEQQVSDETEVTLDEDGNLPGPLDVPEAQLAQVVGIAKSLLSERSKAIAKADQRAVMIANKAADLDRLGVPLDASWQKAREAFREAGLPQARAQSLRDALAYRIAQAEGGDDDAA